MKKWNRSFLYSIYVFVLLPTIVILPFSVFSTMYFKNFYEDSLQNRYIDHLESIYNQNEIHLESITKNVQFLEGDPAFMQVMLGMAEEASVQHVQEQLQQFALKYALISDAYIIDVNHKKVYTMDKIFDMEAFFQEEHPYEDYNTAYWHDYRNPFSEKRIIPPSMAMVEGAEMMVMPIVYSRIGETHISSLLVIDVSLDYIFAEMEKNNTEFSSVNGMVSRYTGNWYGSNGTAQKMSSDFILKIMVNGQSVFDYEMNGVDSMMVAYCPHHSVLGYAYVAGIPRSVINNEVYKIIWVLVLVWAIVFLISFLVIRFSAKKLYAPIRSLLDLVSQGEGRSASPNDDFSYIQNFIRQSMRMKENYIPIVQENLLLNFLRGEGTKEETEAAFAENGLVFQNPAFCVVFLRLRPTAQYYKKYPQVTYENMAKKLLDVLLPCFPESYDVYNLTFGTDTMCIVLNVQEGASFRDVEGALQIFSDCLASDRDTIQMRVSVGRIYSGIGGMKKSYEEALERFEGLTVEPGSGKIEERKRKPLIFGEAEETTLTNYLLAGQVQPAREYINHLIFETKEKGGSVSSIHNLYVRLCNTVLNVMRLRRIVFEGKAVDDIDFERFYSLPPEELGGEMEKMLDAIEGKLAVNRIKIEEVIDDIQQHYTEDIRLDELAEKYRTSASYLSRLLKDGLGMTFVDYVARLRIQRAKELLEKTDKSIAEIGDMCGFTNPSGFTRVFKANIGISPLQYRKTIGK